MSWPYSVYMYVVIFVEAIVRRAHLQGFSFRSITPFNDDYVGHRVRVTTDNSSAFSRHLRPSDCMSASNELRNFKAIGCTTNMVSDSCYFMEM
ncbi:hypothetical protein Y032_0683g1499 [Ancylostoma ceylanicum]|nr:hypothetical protein Y032_0683g1499 [Ancylostoma ceylanicum]